MAAEILLAFSTAVAVYVLAGYPFLLTRFWRHPLPVRKDLGFQPTVSVVMAVHNGEPFLGKKLESLVALNYPVGLVEILVVSDGSTDATDAIAESFADRRVRLIRVPRAGKPAALNAGLGEAVGEILFFTDVRQPVHPEALAHMAANFADPSVGVVSGEPRFLGQGPTGVEGDLDKYWKYELWVRRRHSEIDSACNTTGSIYTVRRSLVEAIPEDTLTDDAVIPLRACFQGYRIIVDPEAVVYEHRSFAGGEFKRKLRTLSGLWQVHVRLPQLFTRANRMRFHFFSHKSARLVLPWVFLVWCGASIALPASPFRTLLLGGEVLLVAMAAADWLVPKSFRLKRLTSPARSFLAMNAASLLSIGVFVAPPKPVWQPSQVKLPR
jgi:cellulose synthase/poly-beta-1,6-N-acetylglucosamine synthase-like glycosyltransferase